MVTKKSAPKADPTDLLDGDAPQLRSKLKKIHGQEREIAKLEKKWNDKKLELKEAHAAHDKAVLRLREMISGIPQAEMPFDEDDDGEGENGKGPRLLGK